MDMTGERLIPAPRAAVWSALNDVEVLKASIPGCQEITKTSETEMAAKLGLKIGPVSANFTGKVQLSDIDPPNGYTISGEGSGGVAGFAKGGADISLTPKDGGTELSYTARADIGGKLAQIGQRLIDGAARQLADQFFERFSAAVAPPSEAAPAPLTVPPQPERAGQQSRIWALGLAGVILVMVALFLLVL